MEKGETDGSEGGAYRHNTPLPTPIKSKIIGILNRMQVIISSARVTAENIGVNILIILVIGALAVLRKVPLSLVLILIFGKLKGHDMLLSYRLIIFSA